MKNESTKWDNKGWNKRIKEEKKKGRKEEKKKRRKK